MKLRERVINILLSPWQMFQRLEQGFYTLRELLWNYPDYLVLSDTSLWRTVYGFYQLLRPYSFFALAALVLFAVGAVLLLPNVEFNLTANDEGKLLEGVVMGIGDDGTIQKLAKINPLIPSTIQLEKDLNQLIYEPLIRYNQDGTITNVLAVDIVRRQEGAEYIFQLKEGVKWHDGQSFGTDDVLATLNLISDLAANEELRENAFVKAISQMGWETVGNNSIAVCTLAAADLEDFHNGVTSRPCTGASGLKPIISNFLELVAIKIMPAHQIGELNVLNINRPDPVINRYPVGTGSFRFVRGEGRSIQLTRNLEYHNKISGISDIEFILYPTEGEAVLALQRGEIHGLATVSTDFLQGMNSYKQIDIMFSDVLANQYWALYFNLRKDPDGNTLGPIFFQDSQVRRALALAINKQRIIDALLGLGQVTHGPISPQSDFYNAQAKWPMYNLEEAKQILDKAGWVVGSDGIREKEGVRMEFSLAFANNSDRIQTAEAVITDFAALGVKVKANPLNQKELVNQVVTPKAFDMLLYGVRTFIDPDRYELFHSQQAGLSNLSSFKGKARTTVIRNGKTARIPDIDHQLELGRSLDPLEAKEERKNTYKEFQRLLAEDLPAIFLYSPEFIYYRHKSLKGVSLENAQSVEDRLLNVEKWRL
jgi:peptide/nickel transport system substrate-binding protein